MAIKTKNFGGPLIWLLRKYCSSFTSKVMLKFVSARRFDITQSYIDWFMEQDKAPLPLNVMIETINRCNGKCEFCPANVSDEKRQFKKMPE